MIVAVHSSVLGQAIGGCRLWRYVDWRDGLEDALRLVKAPEARLAELSERLRVFYVKRGFLDVEVSLAERGAPADTVHYLAFTIHEHGQVRVTRRVFPCLDGEFTPDYIGGQIGSFLEEDLPGAEPFGAVDPRAFSKLRPA